jgi:formamidopyrimidine-DNA glycosylase
MPEMPEVETLARELRKAVIGKRIAEVHLSGLPLRRPVASTFAANLAGRLVRKIHRRGKYLIVEMEPRSFWVLHLGMSGRICYGQAGRETAKHTHATFRFADATELQYRDHRRFGLLAAYEVARLKDIPELRVLGRDPLSQGFTADWLGERLRYCRQEIKSFLLDQRIVAGIGNIYACETLYLAGIHPARRCWTLSPDEISNLVKAARSVLRAAIRHRGTSFSDFISLNETLGGHQNHLRVFQREGEACDRCASSIIERTLQGNRSSFFCPCCQK